MRLREYRSADAAAILSWCADEKAFRKWTADCYDHFPIAPADMDALYAKSAAEGFFRPFTATDDSGCPVGHFILRQPGDDPKRLMLGFIIVDGSLRGQGVGRQMVSMAAEHAKSAFGAERVTLRVFSSNPAAMRCYAAAGFSDSGELHTQFACMGETWECITMTRAL